MLITEHMAMRTAHHTVSLVFADLDAGIDPAISNKASDTSHYQGIPVITCPQLEQPKSDCSDLDEDFGVGYM